MAKNRKRRTSGKEWTKDKSATKDTTKEEIKKSDRTNDVSWYSRSEQSLKDTASLAFSDVLGLPDNIGQYNYRPDLGTGTASVAVNASAVSVLPGIVCADWGPATGSYSPDPDSAVNVAALNVYSYVRHANSGHANYDAVDLMMYILAVGNYLSWLAHLIRAYGLMMVYNQTNRYMPEALIKALGFDFNDLVANLSSFRAYINQKISEASVLWIPNTMPIVARWFWMNTNVFTDGEARKAQLYVYRPGAVWVFQNKTSSSGSSLKWTTTGTNKTFADIVSFTNAMSLPLISDEDIGIMGGDILKAFGSDKIYGLSQIPDDYMILPVYDEEVLMQLHNMDIATYIEPTDVVQDLTSDPGVIVQNVNTLNPASTNKVFGLTLRKYFDLKGNANDPAIVMVASRLKVSAAFVPGTTDSIRLDGSGTEVILSCRAIANPNLGISGSSVQIESYLDTSTDAGRAEMLKRAAVLGKCHWGPIMYGISSTLTSGKMTGFTVNNVVGEFENYTTIGSEELQKMHRIALYSEFGVPYI